MAFVLGFLPWIAYWALVGNVPFRVATSVVLAVAVAVQVLGRVRHQPSRSLEVGSLAVFALFAVAAFVVDDGWLQRWMQPLSNAGLLLVALGGMLVGRPFVEEYAAASVDAATARTSGFAAITRGMTWLWIGIFAGMTVISAVPPVLDGDATLRDSDDLLSILCYWVLPYVLLAVGGLVSSLFPPWFQRRSAMIDRREAAEVPAVAAPPPEPPDLSVGGLTLDVPDRSRHDEAFPVTVLGAAPGSRVELTTVGDDLFGRRWRSVTAFVVPESGQLDVEATAPVAGGWTHPTPGAPLTMMRFAADATPDLFVPPQRWAVTLEGAADGSGGRVRRTVHRTAGEPGVRHESVDIGGLPGLLALPPGDVPAGGWPAVACFGGSEGGFASQTAHVGLLASRGYAALAACWVSEADAATAIARIPLERFAGAVELLAARPEIDAGRVAAMAVSRGAEGLLAAMSARPQVPCRGLTLMSPSSLSWQAIGGDGEIPDTPSWTLAGAPVPWRPLSTGVLMPQIIRNAWRIGRDAAAHRPTLLRLRPSYEAGLQADGPGDIAAERVPCPLLLLTGTDDAVWPSGPMAEALLARRDRTGDRHVSYPGAGHLIRLGALPTDAQWTNGIAMGGTPDGQAAAQLDATTQVVAFLATATARTAGQPA